MNYRVTNKTTKITLTEHRTRHIYMNYIFLMYNIAFHKPLHEFCLFIRQLISGKLIEFHEPKPYNPSKVTENRPNKWALRVKIENRYSNFISRDYIILIKTLPSHTDTSLNLLQHEVKFRHCTIHIILTNAGSANHRAKINNIADIQVQKENLK